MAFNAEKLQIIFQTQNISVKFINDNINKCNGIVECIHRIYNEQGPSAFWSAFCARVLCWVMIRAVEKCCSVALDMSTFNSSNVALRWALCTLAKAFSLAVVFPLEYAVTRLSVEAHPGKLGGLIGCIQEAYHAGGLRAFYHGFAPAVVGLCIHRAAIFGFYYTCKRWPSSLVQRYFGFLSHPFDTICRQLMVSAGSGGSAFGLSSILSGFWVNAPSIFTRFVTPIYLEPDTTFDVDLDRGKAVDPTSPSAEPGARTCAHCSKVGASMKKCRQCKKIYYCSKACQVAHWPTHRVACSAE